MKRQREAARRRDGLAAAEGGRMAAKAKSSFVPRTWSLPRRENMADAPGENPSDANAPPHQQQQQQPSDNAGGGNSHPPSLPQPPPPTAQPAAAPYWTALEASSGLHLLVHSPGCAECEGYVSHLGEHHYAGSPQYVSALENLRYHWAKTSFLHEYTQREGLRFI